MVPQSFRTAVVWVVIILGVVISTSPTISPYESPLVMTQEQDESVPRFGPLSRAEMMLLVHEAQTTQDEMSRPRDGWYRAIELMPYPYPQGTIVWAITQMISDVTCDLGETVTALPIVEIESLFPEGWQNGPEEEIFIELRGGEFTDMKFMELELHEALNAHCDSQVSATSWR